MIQKFGQSEPDPDLNSDMTDYPNFKFEQKFCDCTRFFPVQTNPGNRIGRIFASPNAGSARSCITSLLLANPLSPHPKIRLNSDKLGAAETYQSFPFLYFTVQD